MQKLNRSKYMDFSNNPFMSQEAHDFLLSIGFKLMPVHKMTPFYLCYSDSYTQIINDTGRFVLSLWYDGDDDRIAEFQSVGTWSVFPTDAKQLEHLLYGVGALKEKEAK